MWLKLFGAFGDQNGNYVSSVFSGFLALANAAVLLKKTSKAVQEQHDGIYEACQQVETLPWVLGNDTHLKPVNIIRSFLRINAFSQVCNVLSYCVHCKKRLDKDGNRYCSKCKRACYCSRECQVSNWKEHKIRCKLLANGTEKNIDFKYFTGTSSDSQQLCNLRKAGTLIVLVRWCLAMANDRGWM